jgi:hypothetical protein
MPHSLSQPVKTVDAEQFHMKHPHAYSLRVYSVSSANGGVGGDCCRNDRLQTPPVTNPFLPDLMLDVTVSISLLQVHGNYIYQSEEQVNII